MDKETQALYNEVMEEYRRKYNNLVSRLNAGENVAEELKTIKERWQKFIINLEKIY